MANKKLLFILLLLCCVLLAVLIFSNDKSSRYSTEHTDQLLLPELRQRLNDIAAIQIDTVGESVVLEVENENWTVASKQNYPADTSSIRQLIYGMADLKIAEVKTADESLLSKIGLTLDSEEAVRIKLMDDSGIAISDIVFGKSRTALSGQGQEWFARQYDDAQSWLVNGQIELYRNAYQWLSKTVLSVNYDDVREVVLNREQEDRLVILKSAESDSFELQGMQDDEEIESYKLEDIVETASSIQLDDVRLNPGREASSGDAIIELRTKDGLAVVITVRDREQGWISLQAKAESDNENAIEQSQSLNQRWSNWEFQMPGYKLNTLLQKKQDLILKKESS